MSAQGDSEFDSLGSLLTFVFNQLQTPMLTVDRILEYLSKTEYTVQIRGQDVVPANAIQKRLIVNCLTTSDLFVRSGPIQSQTFALRPNNPVFRCETVIAATIEQILCENGPMTIEELVASAGLPDADTTVFERIISQHPEFCAIPQNRLWFTNAPIPTATNYNTITEALQMVLQSVFMHGACIDDLRRYLCLSTVHGFPITRKSISTELSTNVALFIEFERGKYTLAGSPVAVPDPVVRRPRAFSDSPSRRNLLFGHANPPEKESDDEFNPDAFFGGSFTFSAE